MLGPKPSPHLPVCPRTPSMSPKKHLQCQEPEKCSPSTQTLKSCKLQSLWIYSEFYETLSESPPPTTTTKKSTKFERHRHCFLITIYNNINERETFSQLNISTQNRITYQKLNMHYTKKWQIHILDTHKNKLQYCIEK
ncbi:hypothetical protein ILYODFUR_024743 [Ilyodon furcidens]|uniref:Uncharacterized protein n=1 Tax=Ilyodon furcidens TaxID=33524 RepID=A0ABV0V804_9TELE